MDLKSRYRLMRMRSHLGGGRARRNMLMALLMVAAALVAIAGLIVAIVLVCAGTILIVVLYVWSGLRRMLPRHEPETTRDDQPGHGDAIEGEYTVQNEKPGTHERRQ